MKINILTIFPEIFAPFLNFGIIKKARENREANIDVLDLRSYTVDKHSSVDDYPYGGGPGMVLKPEPIWKAVESLPEKTHLIYLTPQGHRFDQNKAWELSEKDNIGLLCGRYEGIDQRVRENLIDEEISVGDYVLTGGEIPAMAITEAVVRLLPGVLGDENSAAEDSFFQGLLDHPHYTRPAEFKGMSVPEVLLSGDHARIALWRKKQQLSQTLRLRPDLLKEANLDQKERELLEEVKKEMEMKRFGKEANNENHRSRGKKADER